jgi:hypothetical protein
MEEVTIVLRPSVSFMAAQVCNHDKSYRRVGERWGHPMCTMNTNLHARLAPCNHRHMNR